MSVFFNHSAPMSTLSIFQLKLIKLDITLYSRGGVCYKKYNKNFKGGALHAIRLTLDPQMLFNKIKDHCLLSIKLIFFKYIEKYFVSN